MNHQSDDKNVSRREVLAGLAGLAGAVGVAGVVGCDSSAPIIRGPNVNSKQTNEPTQTPNRMPVGYVGHGAPTLVFDQKKGADLRQWADDMPRPRAMLVISAHWQDTPVSIGTTERRELMYDFYGFPKELYEVEYDAPAAPELADRVADLLGGDQAMGEQGPVQRESRSMDHGVWVPMVHMAPKADVPILQISLPSKAGPEALFALGRTLAPLRDEGIFLLGSGSLVHNLRRVDFSEQSPPQGWAVEFDQWAAETLAQRNFDELIDYRNHAPGLRIAHPTVEHFEPILVAAGAASVDEASTSFPVEGFEFGNLSRRCVQFG